MKGLKPKSVRNYLFVIRRMLRVAVRFKPHRRRSRYRSDQGSAAVLQFFTAEEASRLVAAADSEWRCLILTAIRTGLKNRRVARLQWEDVDLKGGR